MRLPQRRSPLDRLVTEQAGVTLIEAVVAALLLTLGALSTLALFDSTSRSNYRAEQSQVTNNRLQAELEEIRQLPYAEIGLTSTPSPSGDTNDPRWRVQGASFAVGRDGSDQRIMVVNDGTIPGKPDQVVEGGVVDPGPEPFTSGDVSGQIYRFVTWSTDPNCSGCGEGLVKRVIVAVALENTASGGERTFQEVQSEISDPGATPADNPAPPENPVETAKAEFWLTDTTCNHQNRQPITSSHAAHNTRGRCANGPQSGNTRGAPDLMFTSAPQLDPDYPLDGQPLYDYGTDSAGSTEDKIGLAMPWPSSDSCLLEPVFSLANTRLLLDSLLDPLLNSNKPAELDGMLDVSNIDGNRHLRVHKWVSPPISSEGGVLIGKGTLELYTRTVDGATHPGEICLTLFVRQTVQVPICPLLGLCLPGTIEYVPLEVDVPFVNTGALTTQGGVQCAPGQGLSLTYFRCQMSAWPQSWTRVAMPLTFAAINSADTVIPAALPPGSRIGLALSARKSGTQPGDTLEFMYDAVRFESRLELESEQPLAFEGA